MSIASALGAGTIINAIATLQGAAFGIDLRTYAEVTIKEDGIICEILDDPTADTTLISECARLVLARSNIDVGLHVSTRSEVPIASGLKSSSAAANATVLAALDTLDLVIDPIEVVRLGVAAARRSGVTITGAFDDACASFFGGLVLTDNENDVLLTRTEVDSDVVVYVPKVKSYSADTNVLRSKLLAPWIRIAFSLAHNGKYENAMVLNGLLYCSALGFSPEPILMALESGARGATLSGTGPSYVALVDKKHARSVAEVWDVLEGSTILTHTSNSGARIEND
jgi:shikimate kinase